MKTLPERIHGFLLPLLLLLTLPAVVQAQFMFSTNNGSITITLYTGHGGVLVIPSTTNGYPVTSIAAYAFHGSGLPIGGLTSVTIPNSVTNIGAYAFANCSSLTNITIGSGVADIGTYAFYKCSALTSVTIPNSVANIGASAFRLCTAMTNIMLGSGVTNIGSGVFSFCSSLKAINVDDSNPIFSSGNGALCDKNQTTIIKCPEGKAGGFTIPNSVTNIGSSAFYYCTALTNITIGSNLINIESGAFFRCIGLTAITVDASNLAYCSVDGVLFDKNQTALILYPVTKVGSYTITNSVTSVVRLTDCIL